ncbi:hypothetical protein Ntsu_10170 [Nocardia sp. IFM 10818]
MLPVDISTPNRDSDTGNRSPRDRYALAAAGPVSDFHGAARPDNQPDLSQTRVRARIGDNVALITPEGVAWNGDMGHFVLPDGQRVTVVVEWTSNNAVAEFFQRDDGSFGINVSPRARDVDVVRAVAHELAEIRLSTDPEIDVEIDTTADRPGRLTTHLGGRFAEIRVLTADIDAAVHDPARAHDLPRLRKDLNDLLDRLGFNDPAHGDTVRAILADHDALLAHRIELEQQGLLQHRPTFDTNLTDADFDRAAADHLAQLQQQLSGDFVDDVVRAEQMALDGRMREELARRVFDPLFAPDAKGARRTVDLDTLLKALDPVNAAMNDPATQGRDRADALHRAIDGFHDAMPQQFRDAFGPDRLARMHSAADAFADAPNRITGSIDTATGALTVNGRTTTLGDFLRSVDSANRGATQNGLNLEYTVVIHDAVDGNSSVEILSRPRPQHRLPIDQNLFGPDNTPIQHQPRDSVPAAVNGGHTIDVGVGRSAFGVEMTPAADRSGDGLVIKTELASEFPVKGQRRRDLGIMDPGPLTEPGTVMVFGDLLSNGHLLGGDTARVYINNVSAHLPDSAYGPMAANLAASLAPGARVEIQWDMKPDKDGEPLGNRGHIDGTKLWAALENHYRNEGVPNPFRMEVFTAFPPPGNTDYDYTIDAGASNNLNHALMSSFSAPQPEHRMVIAYDPAGADGARQPGAPARPDAETDSRAGDPAHGTASPVGDFRGDARTGEHDLDLGFVRKQLELNLALVAPADVSWNIDTKQLVLRLDGQTIPIDIAVGPTTDNAVADFTARTDESGNVTGYDINVSPRARDQDVLRALAHELAEIRLSQDPEVRVDPNDDRPSELTSHLGGRIAELDVLTAQIDRATFDQARAAELPGLRKDLADLLDHLGYRDPAHADTVQRLLAEHDPQLARRLELEQQGLNGSRPTFNATLDADPNSFDRTSADHLDQLRQLVTGDNADALLRAERMAMDSGLREELARRVFQPVFAPEAKSARRALDLDTLLSSLDPINAAINDPATSGPDKAAAIRSAVDDFVNNTMPQAFRDAFPPDALARMHNAADAFAHGPDRITAMIDPATGLTVNGEPLALSDFLRDVDRANRAATAHGLNLEYVVVLHDPVDGRQAVEVLARPRPVHRLTIDQYVSGSGNTPIPFQPRPSVQAAVDGGFTIDVGVGRSAFGVEMTPIADRSGGGLIVKTELAAEFPIKAQRRYDLGIDDPGPLTEPGTVMVFGDLLFNGHVLGDGAVGDAARIYVNNVSAHPDSADYDTIAAELARTLTPGGQIEIQWDTKPEEEGGTPGDRGHITGPDLWQALQRHYQNLGLPNPFHIAEHTVFADPGNADYLYSIDAGASKNLPLDRMDEIKRPVPEQRMIIVYDPAGVHTPQQPDAVTPAEAGTDARTAQNEHGTAAPVGEFRGDARPDGAPDLSRDFVINQLRNNLGLITPGDVTWNRDTNQFVLEPDGRGLTVTIDVGPTTGNAVADFTARTDDSGNITGYDVNVSPRARDEDVTRALAHELAEIRLSQDPDVLVDPTDDRPDRLTTHLGGRFAELGVLTAQIDRAATDPARAHELPGLRQDLNDLLDHLGRNDPVQADTLRQLLTDHDPALVRRLDLEQQGLHSNRPIFDPNLTNPQFDQASADHLDQLRQLLTDQNVDGGNVDALVRAEQMSLNARMREELARRIFDPLFDADAKPARRTVNVQSLLSALDPVNAAINDPNLNGPDRAEALHRALDRFRASMPDAFREAFGPDRFDQMYSAADAFAAAPNRITGVIDQHTGQLTINGEQTTLGDFLRSVDNANRAATTLGLNVEYTVVVHDPADGKATVDVMSRPRPQHRLPIDQNVFGENNTRIPHEPRPSVPAAVAGGHTIDVGTGRSAYGVEMTPVADRSGDGLVIKTELAYDFPVAGQRRRDLGILDPGPLTEPGTVMVFGDLLFNGHILGDSGAGDVARIYINNVSAHLPDTAYADIAAELANTMLPGGRIELQWDTKPEEEGGTPGDRGHITGSKLWDAIQEHYRNLNAPNPFHIAEHTVFDGPGNRDYDYTIDAGASNNLNAARMAEIVPPLPEQRMVIVFDPDGVSTPQRNPDTESRTDDREHGTASPVADFHGTARPEGTPNLSRDFVLDQVRNNLGLITPENVAWNRDTNQFVLESDGRTLTVTVDVGSTTDNAVADFTARTDENGKVTGYDINVSPRARDEDVTRALAHELAEIRLLQDPELLVDPSDDRPSQLTPHLGGRIAEIDVLTAQIDRSATDPARAHELPSLRQDLSDLLDHLGWNDPAHADTLRQLITDQNPGLVQRLDLEQQGLHAHRPAFDPGLTNSQFDQASADHLNQLRDLLTGDDIDIPGDRVEDLLQAERMSLDARMREELARRIFDPLFEQSTKPARGLVKVKYLLGALDPVNAVINDPNLRGPEQAQALRHAIARFRDDMPEKFHDALGPDVIPRMYAAADAFAAAPNRISGVIDQHTGQLTINGEQTTLGDFLRSVDSANRAATALGLNVEYTVVVHDPADGRATIDVMSRPRPQHRLPLDQNVFGENNTRIPHDPRPSVPAAVDGGHTIDVGVGRSAFGVEMTPVADRSGDGLVIKTELAYDFPVAGQRRRDLGILDPGPLTEPGTVMVFGDLLSSGHLLTAGPEGGAARIYINNVSADLPDAAYRAIAANLAATLAPGGQIEIQWDMKPEEEGGTPGDRKHILGTKLWKAIEAHYAEQRVPNPFEVRENVEFPYPGNTNYDYTIDAGASNKLNTARMAKFNPPMPEHRMIIAYAPDADGAPARNTSNPEAPEHGTASPVGDFRGDARPDSQGELTLDAVRERLENNLGLIQPSDVTWNDDTNQFELRRPDGTTLPITVNVGPTTDNAVADFTARTDDNGNLTGYDINVSPGARDQDILRALAHELAEISLSLNPDVLTDTTNDQPSQFTSHLGGRYAELHVLTEQIGEITRTRDKAGLKQLPSLRRDLTDLIRHIGLHDPDYAPTAERLLAQHDSDLARYVDQVRIPDAGILRPGAADPDATPTPHDLGRIRQLRELADQMEQVAPESPEHDALRREGLALVERLGLREGTPGAAARRQIVGDRLTEHARQQVDRMLSDIGRRDIDLPEADQQLADRVRTELRAAAALDFLIPEHSFHFGTLMAYQEYQSQIPASGAAVNIVEDPDTGARWYSWPPGMDLNTDGAPVADIGLPTDPQQLHDQWSDLSDAEKDALYQQDPFLGARDGIPQVDRDRFNRQTLAVLHAEAARAHQQAEQAKQQIEADSNPDADLLAAAEQRVEQTKERLAQIDDMLSLLDAPPKPGVPPILLSFLDADLHYIYALGNPDTADNQAIALAGAFRRRSGVGYAVQILEQLRDAALAINPNAETSVMLFGAYNNPARLVEGISSRGAEEGAQTVRDFHDGLRVTHQGPPANVTTIAHSYGGVTGGHSAGHGHELNTDALVFIGALGAGVPHVSELRLTGVDPADIRDHVFATLAEHDSVMLMPPTQGPAPTDPDFGATVFDSDSAPSPTRLGWNPDTHQAPNYFNSGHPSYRSLGLILNGEGHQLNQPSSEQNPTDPPEHGTASPVGDFRGDARPDSQGELTLDAVRERLENNLGLIQPSDVTWNDDTEQFELRRPDGTTLPITVSVGPTTGNAVADFTARTDADGNLLGYDINVSPGARDQDIVRALAHELAEISLSLNPDVVTDTTNDRPSQFTSHLGGRYAELQVLTAQIDEISASRDKQLLKQLPGLRQDLADLIRQIGLNDPNYAPTAERLLAHYDSDLARQIDQARIPDETILKPGEVDPDARPTPHDLGRIRQLRELAEQLHRITPEARQGDPAARAEYDAARREALALVERLGLREGTPGAAARREIVSDRLNEQTRTRVDRMLSDVGRRDADLPEADRRFAEDVRTELRAGAALDFLSPLHTFHIGVLKAHQAYRAQIPDSGAAVNIVTDPETGARWYSWPPGMELNTASAPLPDIGIPTDPQQLHDQWSDLSDAQKDALFQQDPFLGARDGIPQVDRDRFNRQTLAGLRADAVQAHEQAVRQQEQARADQNQTADRMKEAEARVKQTKERLAQIDDMLSLLDAPPKPGVPPILLSYLDAELRYVYALGNPDTADNQAIALAGAFRRRSGVGYAVQILEQLRDAALAVNPEAETSVMLFGAYNNPAALVEGISSRGAEEGATKVREFHDGLRITHQGPTPANVTTIAHSYGGVTGGHSAGHGHSLNTDALVFIGALGAGVPSVADLRLTGVDPENNADHVFATMAEHDSVLLMPPTQGPAPTDPAFGATVFDSDSAPSPTRLGWNPDTHLAPNYFNSQHPSYRSLGLILNGEGHQLNQPADDDQNPTNPPEHGTAGPVGQFRGDARPPSQGELTLDAVNDRIQDNLDLIRPADITWNQDDSRFQLHRDGRTYDITVNVGPTTGNAVADFTARTDADGNLLGYDINVSPGARDQDITRALAHELAEISLSLDPDVQTDTTDDRPSRMTSHLGGRFAEIRVLVAEIEAAKDPARAHDAPQLRQDLIDLLRELGYGDPAHAETVRKLLAAHDPALADQVAKMKLPVPPVLPQGVIGWGADPLQASIVDVFVDPAPDPVTGQRPGGLNQDMLPHIPGGPDPMGANGSLYELPFADAGSKLMVLFVNAAKLSGFTLFADADQPDRIRPGFVRPKWFNVGASEVQPLMREFDPADHAAADTGEIHESWQQRQREAAADWARVQAWADRQYARFIADQNANGPDNDVAAITRMLDEYREVRRRELDEFINAANELATGRAGKKPNKLITRITRLLGDENALHARQLAADLRENLNRVAAGDRAELARVLDERLRAVVGEMLPPAFTAEQIQQIKDHLMRDPHWGSDPETGRWVQRPFDAVADVAEAWNRLLEGSPKPADILLLKDALAESNFLRDNPTASWRDASNNVTATDGPHWSDHRPPLTGDRAGIPYAPGRPGPQPDSGTSAGADPDGPDSGGPDPDGPDSGGPDTDGPDSGGPNPNTPPPNGAQLPAQPQQGPAQPEQAPQSERAPQPEQASNEPEAGVRPEQTGQQAETPRSEYERLLQQRKELVRELEFQRAQRDDRVDRLLDIGDPEAALGTRERLQETVLRLFDESATRTVNIDGNGDEAPHRERQANSPEEVAHRRDALRKLTAAAEDVIGLREQIHELDQRIHELERTGANAGLPRTAEVTAEMDRLAAERADELLRIKPRRAARDDLAAELGALEADLAPQEAETSPPPADPKRPDGDTGQPRPHERPRLLNADGSVNQDALSHDNLDTTVQRLRDAFPDRAADINALEAAARDVNLSHNKAGRIQDEMARIAGEWRRIAATEGARMVTDHVAIMDGQPRRIIVFGPRDAVGGRPFADHDSALADALRHNATVAQAMVDPATVVERRRVTVGRADQVSVTNHRGPRISRLTGRNGFNSTRWRDAEGRWHTVDPTRPDWVGNRDPGTLPKAHEDPILIPGVFGWGADPLQAAVVDVFVDPAVDPATGQRPTGFNQDLLPHMVGGSKPMVDPDIPTYELPFADAASKLMVFIVQSARLSGFTWFADPLQPSRIRPGFKRPKWTPVGSAEVQPMVREWENAEHVPDNGEIDESWHERRRVAAEKWAKVQSWADRQYARFTADQNADGPDNDVEAIARTLGEYRETRRRDLAAFVDAALDVAAGPATVNSDKLVRRITRLLGEDNADYAKQLASDLRENLRKVPPTDRNELGRVLDERLRAVTDSMLPPVFTAEQIQQVKDYLMRESHWSRDPVDGQWVHRPFDAVADVAEAWNRLLVGSPQRADILLLQDALAESNFLRANPTATWRQANAHVAALDGFHWDAARPPLTGDRAGIAYEPGPIGAQPNSADTTEPEAITAADASTTPDASTTSNEKTAPAAETAPAEETAPDIPFSLGLGLDSGTPASSTPGSGAANPDTGPGNGTPNADAGASNPDGNTPSPNRSNPSPDGNTSNPDGNDPERGTASPVGEFRGDARPMYASDLTLADVVGRIDGNLGLIQPENVGWDADTGRFQLRLEDGRVIPVTVNVAPTTGNAVADFAVRTDDSGNVAGYDINVSPRARDVDVVRALAHELAEISLENDPAVHTDRTEDRPARLTSHLGGRYAELRVLNAQIDEVIESRDKQRLAVDLPRLRRDLTELMDHIGLRDPAYAPTAERLLAQFDSDLALRADQERMPVEGILRPGQVDLDAEPTPHDLGRIRQLRALAEQLGQISPEARQADPTAQADFDAARREALALVERLGLREGTPGAAARRRIVSDWLTRQAGARVDEMLSDVGRRDADLPDADQRFVDQVRLEIRAADALDFLSPVHTFHIGVLKAHQVFRTQLGENASPETVSEPGNIVEDPDSGARWHSWPPDMDPNTASAPVPDIGLATDPAQLHEQWSQLSDAEKAALYRADPFLGSRDGIPQAERDQFNRQTLNMLRDQAELAQDAARLAQIEDMLDFLDRSLDGQPLLLSYLDAKLQYVYALGNPDTADNVAVALAGALRRRSGVGYAKQILQQVRAAAKAVNPEAETSVLLFGAYNNPASLVEGISSQGAEEGARKVREFHDGLRVTHQGPPAHTTTIAHSYGGVTGGHAAGHGHELNTDALVFVGALGAGVPSVADLRLTGVDPADIGKHVFATMAEFDSVVLMPPTQGPAPTDPAFGATVYRSDSAPSPTRLGWNPNDHLAPNYFGGNNFASFHSSHATLGKILNGLGHELAGPDTPGPDAPEHGTASPIGEFRGDARPAELPDVTRDEVLGRISDNLDLLRPDNVGWNDAANRFEVRLDDGRVLPVTVSVGPTTDNAVADFTARTDDSGNLTGYDINVSPRARDQDIVRALAHELAEITLSLDPNVRTDPTDDRPSQLTSHLGGRYAEMRVLNAQIDEIIKSRDKVLLRQLPNLRQDLRDLMDHIGLRDPDYAPTAERLLSQYNSDLARRMDQERQPVESVLRPGRTAPDAVPTPHDLGRIKQLHHLADQLAQVSPHARAESDALRQEALALVERLGLREGTPGADTRRRIIDDRLTDQARRQIGELLSDVGRRDTDLADPDREFAEQVRLEARAADALDFLSPLHTFHIGTHKAHQEFRRQNDGRAEPDNLVEDPDSGARWYSWPPGMEVNTASAPVPDIGLPTDPRQLHEDWSRLSDAEKDALYQRDPYLGSRDGIPQAERDRYNRRTLATLRPPAEQAYARAQAEYERVAREHEADPSLPEDELKAAKDRLDLAKARFEQIVDMLKFLDTPPQQGQPPILLSYLDDKLQYVYALGDPDRADNVAIALAGAFRRRSGVGYALQTLQQFRQAALAIDPDAETSTLLFGAYNNPDSLVKAISSRGAEEGAAKVREFHDGLRVTNLGERVQITTIAHSYGGVTGGHSAGHGHELDTDALVFIGALGAGVPTVADLRLTGIDPADIADHVFATMAEWDSALLMPPTQGPAPTDPGFGATVFDSDSRPSDTRRGWNPDDHLATNYFDSGNRSYESLGLIITGRGHLIRRTR